MQTDALLTVIDLEMSLPSRLARRREILRGVSFEIHDGETLALLGETGCGKSLVLRAITGLGFRGKTRGKVHLRGDARNLLKARTARLRRLRGGRISYLFGDAELGLYPHVSVGAQMKDVLICHRPELVDAREEMVHWLSKAGVPEPEVSLTAMPGELDSVLRMRILIAIAFSTLPQLILADEPTSQLDQASQEMVLGLLGELTEQTGVAMLLTTRDFRVAYRVADRLALLEGGVIVESGPLESILNSPRHELMRELLAATPGIGGV